ncbi:MAG: hypothetical protein AAFV85_13140 [Cyanobacteria bacterium J06634_6]
MGLNKYQDSLLILPEDDANRQLAVGFSVNLNVKENAIQVLNEAGGWSKAVDSLEKTYSHILRKYTKMRIVLLIDFDQRDDRLAYVQQRIPDELRDRVFILGVQSEPERLKASLRKGLEAIGESMADDCANDTDEIWGHALLNHNQAELARMIRTVKPFLLE